MKTLKQFMEAIDVSSADFKISSSGRKVHKREKIADTDYVEPKDDKDDKKEVKEAVDKQEQRFIMLARLGLVDKTDVSKLRIAMGQLKADKPLTIQQRTLLLGVMSDLVSLVTGDDTIFNRAKMDVRKEDTQLELDEGENKQMKGKDPCWNGYQMVGMKDKNGKKVPNCVPEETVKEEKDEPPFEKPYKQVKDPVTTDKSGAKHDQHSRVKHLARLALKKQQNKSK
jgi:hypothetical protein